jgi:hypothetical protein
MIYVAKAEANAGWRIWNRQQKRWWGERYINRPDALVDELNGQKRPDRLAELQKSLASQRYK